MQERWENIEDFPHYAVSNYGDVVNLKTDCLRKQTQNQQGVSMVTISRNGRGYTKAVGLLVARAHVLNQYDAEVFNTPIHLDGNRTNCHAENLMWRPRWFAIKYHQQFDFLNFRLANDPLEVIQTKEAFDHLRIPSVKYGLLYTQIVLSALNRNVYTLPTGWSFRFLREK
jgi:hypothetical protein